MPTLGDQAIEGAARAQRDDDPPPLAVAHRSIPADDGLELFTRRIAPAEGGQTPAIICCNGLGVGTFFWRFIERDFRHQRPVITWDYRGHGRSPAPRSLTEMSIVGAAEDLRAVLDALGVERALCLGHSLGVQVILELERRYPERVAGLVPVLGTYGKPFHTFFNSPIASLIGFGLTYRAVMRHSAVLEPLLRQVAGRRPARKLSAWLARRAGMVDPRLMPAECLDEYLHHASSLDLRTLASFAMSMAQHSAEDHLPHIKAPTLVVAATRDAFTPFWLSEEMVDRIPEAELLVIPEGTHAALVEQPKLLSLGLKDFIARRIP